MLELTDVSMTFPNGVTGLHPVSLDISSGQFTVLLGSSGAGKSTLLRCLNYLNKPTTGNILVHGLGPLSDGRTLRQHRKRTAIIFQQHQLIGRHIALKNVLLGRIGYHGTLRSLFPLPRKELHLALESLDRVELLEAAYERVDNLSGGQQQRVGIARALVQEPKIILADEPVASLDPATSERVLTILHDICKEDGIPAVVSLHQVEFARQYADRIIGLSEGRIVFDGVSEELTPEILEQIYRGTIRSTPAESAVNGGLANLPRKTKSAYSEDLYTKTV